MKNRLASFLAATLLLTLSFFSHPIAQERSVTALFQAIEKDDVEKVKSLIAAGTNVNARNNSDMTPLHWVAIYGFMDIAAFLIENGATIDAKDGDDETPLHQAVEHNNLDVADLLIDMDADVEAIDSSGCTPLFRVRSKEMAELLIENGARVEAKGRDGTTPLHLAIFFGDKAMAMADFFIAKGVEVNARNRADETPLHYAAREVLGKDVAEFLIGKGADVKAKDANGWTPLHVVAYHGGNKNLARLFINAGAEINAKDNQGCTPLHLAAVSGENEVAVFLIQMDADIKAKNIDDETPLHFAETKDLAGLLIAKGANVNARDKYGGTPLHWAATHKAEPFNGRDKDLAELLLAKGADVNARDNSGETPLHKATSVEIVDLLIDKGADTEIKDNQGRTPLDKAVSMGRQEIAEKLVNEGAETSAATPAVAAPKPPAVPGRVLELIRQGKAEDQFYGALHRKVATKFYLQAVALAPEYAGVYIHDNFAAEVEPEFDQAVNACVAAIKKNPRSAGAYANLARLIFLNRGLCETALKGVGLWDYTLKKDRLGYAAATVLLQKALAIDPRCVLAYRALADCGGSYQVYFELFQKILELSPGDMEALESLLLYGRDTTETYKKVIASCDRSLSQGKRDNPEYFKTLAMKAFCHWKVGEHHQAFGIFDEIFEGRPPTDANNLVFYGKMPLAEMAEESLNQNRAGQAVRLSEILVSKTNASDAALFDNMILLGRAYEAEKRDAEAEVIYLQALKSYEANKLDVVLAAGQDICFRLQDFYSKHGDFSKAADYCQRLVNAAIAWQDSWKKGGWDRTDLKYNALLYMLLGQVCRKSGQYGRSIEAQLKSIQLNPNDPVAYKELGLSYYYSGQENAAVNALKRARELAPKDTYNLNWLAHIYLQLGMLDDALETSRQVLAIDQSKALPWIQTGSSLVRLTQYDEAIELLLRGNEQFPDSADIAWWLGKAYQGKGEGGGMASNNMGGPAVKWFREAARLGIAAYGEILQKLEQEGDQAASEGNLYRALQKYTQACQYMSMTVTHPLREKVIRVYNQLPAKPVLPLQAIAFAQRGEEALKKKDYETAIDAYFDALNVAPWWGDGYFNLAIAYHLEAVFAPMPEAFAPAIGCLQYFVALRPPGADAQTARELIDKWTREWRKEN